MKIHILWLLAAMAVTASSCQRDGRRPAAQEADTIGLEAAVAIVNQAQVALLSELQKGLSQGNAALAVSYCNERAYPITDSLANHFGVDIRRVALRWRNENNRPDEAVMRVLEEMTAVSASGQTPEAKTITMADGRQRHIIPIVLKPLCLNCHGSVQAGEIAQATMDEILRLYPNDQATGFRVGDLRGAWVVQPKNLRKSPLRHGQAKAYGSDCFRTAKPRQRQNLTCSACRALLPSM